jgi:hypothetical protein
MMGERGWRFVAATIAVLIVVAALWYVTAPPKGVDAYRERAAATAETARSQVQVARIWVETFGDDEATAAATLVGLEEAETDAAAAVSEFEAYEPPTGAIDLRTRLSGLGNRAIDTLSALRIAAEQERWADLPRLAAPLSGLDRELRVLEERAEP